MEKVIAIHNMYINGMMTFAEFTIAFACAVNGMSEVDAEALIQVTKLEYKEMGEWESTNGVVAAYPAFEAI